MSHLIRRAAVAAVIALGAVGTLGVSPAAAYSTPTHSEVVGALLRSDQLPGTWHRTTYEGVDGTDTTGCDATSRGVARSASRSFRYAQQALFADESVMSYRTLRAARLDVRRAIGALAGCDSLTVDGHPWTVRRLAMRTVADQQAIFELKGFVTTANGDVVVTRWFGVARVGHHVAATGFTVGGPIADADLSTMRSVGRGLLAKSMSKVTNKLGV
jgi:hypothetical protein